MYISIAGIIGAGKTTLATHLANALQVQCFHEQAQDNPYLDLFYKSGTEEFGFPLQVSLFCQRTVLSCAP